MRQYTVSSLKLAREKYFNPKLYDDWGICLAVFNPFHLVYRMFYGFLTVEMKG